MFPYPAFHGYCVNLVHFPKKDTLLFPYPAFHGYCVNRRSDCESHGDSVSIPCFSRVLCKPYGLRSRSLKQIWFPYPAFHGYCVNMDHDVGPRAGGVSIPCFSRVLCKHLEGDCDIKAIVDVSIPCFSRVLCKLLCPNAFGFVIIPFPYPAFHGYCVNRSQNKSTVEQVAFPYPAFHGYCVNSNFFRVNRVFSMNRACLYFHMPCAGLLHHQGFIKTSAYKGGCFYSHEKRVISEECINKPSSIV